MFKNSIFLKVFSSLILSSALFFVQPALARYEVPDIRNSLISNGASSQEYLPQDFNVLVWNIHKGMDRPFWSEFKEFTKSKEVLIIQEMILNPQMKNFIQDFVDYQFLTANSFFEKGGHPTGVANVSTVKSTSVKYFRTKNVEPYFFTPKMVLGTTYKIENSNKELLVINIHGLNIVLNRFWERQIDELYNTYKDFKGPIILAGDFNSWNNDRLRYLKKLCTKLGLKDVKFKEDIRKKFAGNPLDHIFYNQYLEVLDASTISNAKGSDHIPLDVRFRFINLL